MTENDYATLYDLLERAYADAEQVIRSKQGIDAITLTLRYIEEEYLRGGW